MKNYITTPDEIREIALNIIKRNPQGVRQIDLINLILDDFREELAHHKDPMVAVRNAIWNLEVKYPNEISKQNVGGKRALLIPKNSITREREDFHSYNDSEYVNAKLGIESAWAVLNDLEMALGRNSLNLTEIEMITPEQLSYLNMDDIKTLFELRGIVESIRRCRMTVIGREEE
ncbi:hypothetical protein MH117_09925 [Paenibacillus sp. ACRRX]|uniref:hypothetical protein n=1 Tax=Paenibacillus sp. ACRRX TaxID=2918206 RepID=UPI001EF3F20C|nr:hypothetical protein [Paenibacillus sp. ACRRX]MCG7407741.1 hypothetical protein [Paenibacillus sp. ACRRX]